MGLFDSDANIKAALRLSGMPSTADGEAQFQKALLRASVRFRTVIGTDAVTLVTAAGQLAIDQAKLIECDLVYCELLYAMPYTSLDGSAGMDKWVNQEAPFRHLDHEERRDLRTEICGRGTGALDELAISLGIDPPQSEGEIQCWIMDGPDTEGECCPRINTPWTC